MGLSSQELIWRGISVLSVRIVSSFVVSNLAISGVTASTLQPSTNPHFSTDNYTQSSHNTAVVHLPLVRSSRRRNLGQRRVGGQSKEKRRAGGAVLNDVLDITYNVMLTIGEITVPLVLDTGSSDMWVLSGSSRPLGCKTCCHEGTSDRSCSSNAIPLYPLSSLLHARIQGLDVELVYGDSMTGTRAEGVVARDRVGVLNAGADMENQYFAAIEHTNTSVRETGSAGIFGLGFPISSSLWNEIFAAQLAGYPFSSTSKASSSRSVHRRTKEGASSRGRRLPQVPGSQSSYDDSPQGSDDNESDQGGRGQDYSEEIDSTNNVGAKSTVHTPSVLASFEEFGPLISRLFMLHPTGNGLCQAPKKVLPQVSISLQRTVFGDNEEVEGTLTIGGPPLSTVKGATSADKTSRQTANGAGLTWASVRLYTPEQGGAVLPEAPGEMYPYAWEAMMGDVWFNDVKLERSQFGVKDIGVSALIDTGNSLIRGPADVISRILSLIADSAEVNGTLTYPCADAQVLSFEFGGERFDVDPRDFGTPIKDSDDGVLRCTPNLAATDAPELGAYLYSWSLGDPFLKGVLSSFYFGNITHPSVDAPRIGFASSVPPDSANRLRAEVASITTNMAGLASSSPKGSPTDANVVNGEGTPKPIPENLFGQQMPNGGELSRRRPPWVGIGSGSDAEAMNIIWCAVLFAVWVIPFTIIA